MSSRKRGLGRGLDALLGDSFEPDASAAAALGELIDLSLDDLQPGRYQPRTEMDEQALESLAQSIRSQGVLQPLVVRQLDSGYEIVAGERRWRAARMAGLTTVPTVVREIGDDIAMAVALIENIQREDLNPLEEAAALERLISECSMTHTQCAEAVGRSRASVSNLLRLTELEPRVQEYLRQGSLEMGHGRALLGAPEQRQAELAEQVVTRGLTVRQTEALVHSLSETDKPKEPDDAKNPRLVSLEQQLSEDLGASVSIKPGRRGGKVEIRYASTEELESLVKRF